MAEKNRNKTEEAVEELRELVQDLKGQEGCTCEYLQSDMYLLRLLKARRMDVRKAEKLFREIIDWRREKRVEEWMAEGFHPDLTVLFPLHKSHMKTGATVGMVNAGAPDVKSLIEKYGKDRMYQYVLTHVLDGEEESIAFNTKRLEEQGNGEITENFFVGNAFFLDMKNISWKQIACFKNLALAVQLASDYTKFFPGLLSLLVCINCPNAALNVVNCLKRMVESPGFTIEIYGTNRNKWEEALRKRVHPKQLPTIFGGTKIVPELLHSSDILSSGNNTNEVTHKTRRLKLEAPRLSA